MFCSGGWGPVLFTGRKEGKELEKDRDFNQPGVTEELFLHSAVLVPD
jgi:hypothetical protein